MAYNENIPQPTDDPTQSQSQILANYQAISAAFNTNHGNFNAADQGKHRFLQLPEQSSSPSTGSNEGGFFTRESTLTNVTELVFRRESNGSEIEFTSSLGAANGWTFLPSGLLLKWGSGSGSGNHTTAFPVGASIPVFTAVYTALVTTEDSSGSPNTFATFRSVNTTGISVFGSQRTSTTVTTATYNYLVIGM